MLPVYSDIAKTIVGGLDSLFTSDEERAKGELLLTQELSKPHTMQALANIQEAKHPSVFVAGWRPALGWLCVFLLAYSYVGRDFIIIALGLFDQTKIIDKLPVIDSGEIMGLVFALLGLGATRAYEKVKGVARHK